MTTTWWKLLVLQMLICIITNSTALELDDNPRLSNENKMLLFNKLLENQRATEDTNDKVEQIKDLYRQLIWTPFNTKENVDKLTENDIKNDDLQALQFEDPQNIIGIGNYNDKRLQRGKKHYVTTVCHFKICNKKKSLDNYNSFIRYVTKRYNPQQF